MKYYDLVRMMGKEGFFDLASLVQLTGERRESIRMQLWRWCKAGKLLSLRRGMYAFPGEANLAPVHPAELANHLYRPSYISMHWAMGYYGLIPEKVVTYTSVTPRVPRTFENALGSFRYHSIKPEAFFGYRPLVMNGRKVLLAECEKALLDFWHLESGVWDVDRMMGMRFQNAGQLDPDKLQAYAVKFQSPRLMKAAALWITVVQAEQKGTVDV